MDGGVPRRPYYGMHVTILIRFARVCRHVDYLNARNKCLIVKPLKQGYRYHKLRKASSTPWVCFKIQFRLKIYFISMPIGTRILWGLSIQNRIG